MESQSGQNSEKILGEHAILDFGEQFSIHGEQFLISVNNSRYVVNNSQYAVNKSR